MRKYEHEENMKSVHGVFFFFSVKYLATVSLRTPGVYHTRDTYELSTVITSMVVSQHTAQLTYSIRRK